MNEMLIGIGKSFLYAGYFITVLYILNLLANMKIKKYFNPIIAIEEDNNIALVFRRSGLFLGTAIGIMGFLGDNWLLITIETVTLFMFMFIGSITADKLILNNIKNDEEIGKKNITVGIVEMGVFIATGIIAYSSFKGEGPILETFIYFILGQILMIGIYYIYAMTIKFDIKSHVQKNHIPSGILISSMFIALSIILKGAIEGPSKDLMTDLTAFGLSAGVGIIMLILLANKIIDKLFLPTSTIEKELDDNNPAAMLLIGTLKITIALAISLVVI